MSKRLTGRNPLAYLGVEPVTPPQMYMSPDTSPTQNDGRNFNIGDLWVNIEAQDLFVLVSLAQGIATWMSLTGNSASTFVTDSGSASPAAGILNVLGDGVNISTAGSGNTVTVELASDLTIDDLHLTGNLEVDGDTILNGTLTLTGFTNGVLTVNNSGVVGEVTTTDNSLLMGNASGTISSLGVATNGQIPIGSTGNDPVLGTITAGTGISVTNGAGTITLAATGSFASPVTVPNGGTGATSFTPYAVICGGTTSTSPLQSVASVGTSGQILTSNGAGALPTFQTNGGAAGAVTFHTDGSDATASGNAITIAGGAGITTNGSGATVTITATGGGFTWNTVSGTSASLAASNGYITDNVGLVTLTLPASATVGDTFHITGLGAGGWLIAQNSGQLIHFGASVTTTGVGGSLASTNQYNTITLVCTVTDTTFNVLSSIGNITVV